MLDEQLLEQAVQALGAKTYSAAVNLALAEVARIKNVRRLRQFFGKASWEGDLSLKCVRTSPPNHLRTPSAKGNDISRYVHLDWPAARTSWQAAAG